MPTLSPPKADSGTLSARVPVQHNRHHRATPEELAYATHTAVLALWEQADLSHSVPDVPTITVTFEVGYRRINVHATAALGGR